MNDIRTTHQCIYCKEFKTEDKFNREHVISRMLGTYDNAPVLNHFEVCKSCNDYFCDEIENKVSLDSYEGFLRIQHDGKNHKTTRNIGKTRLTFAGQNGIFKNLPFSVSSNPDKLEKIQLKADSVVGIISNPDLQEYDYYHIDEIPNCNDTIKAKMENSKNPFIFFELKREDVVNALKAKGYELSSDNFFSNLDIGDMTNEKGIELKINCKIDILLERLAAKNIFNYLCHIYGKEFVLDREFDSLRYFIRYGKHSPDVIFYVNDGGLSNFDKKVEHGHIIGTAWTAKDCRLYLLGFVSWYNAITYSFLLKNWTNRHELQYSHNFICDNINRKIIEFRNPILLDWPDSEYELEFFDDKYLKIVHKKKNILDK